uniref:RING-type E3 ubiquitin transferase n=1 Tax=Araucaria cunninghamii TaxID=56994 RepID=A0A0D6R549_ARACU
MADLMPCDIEGVCMMCKKVPPDSDVLLCNGCVSPWHMQCLRPPLMEVPTGDWVCPDCLLPSEDVTAVRSASASAGDENDLLSRIRAIQADETLTDEQKAQKRQELISGRASTSNENQGNDEEEDRGARPGGVAASSAKNEVLELFDDGLKCIFCMQLLERPVTTPCGHNFCLKCFQKWMGQGKKNCAKCRSSIPAKMVSLPRINLALVMAIRMAKVSAANASGSTLRTPRVCMVIANQDKPDKAFMTENAKRKGLSNAASGRIFVTVPPDHFGPILAENDPERNQGVLVGEYWGDRMECRQWGVHLPHVAGISGQSDYGAQSVALSGGYEDDEDHGEWFLYTGSGGRDLSGNKRTNKKQSFDQKFDKYNEALRVSCKMGYPVRVVRSHKEKGSSYAPENGVRYDGIYRIEKCWRKRGIQGFKVCRYLFVRCDNEPAPWTSDEHGDQPRPLPKIDELKDASDITVRKELPAWDWKDGRWGWTRDPPPSRKLGSSSGSRKRENHQFLTIKQKLLKEFSCNICKKVLTLPLSTPCGHSFCKACLEGLFAGQQDVRERSTIGGRSLRTQKVVKKCPFCQGDISDFLLRPQVNRQMEDIIQSLKGKVEDGSDSDGDGKEDGDQSEGIENDEMETNCQVEETEGSEEPKVTLVDTSESSKVDTSESFKATEKEGSVEIQEIRTSDTKLPVDIGKRPLNPEEERAIKELQTKYPSYSEELLQSMLVDQEYDLNELEGLLRVLHRQEARANRGVSKSSAAKSKNKHMSVDSPLEKSDAEVFKTNDKKRVAAAPDSTPAKLQKLSTNKSKGTISQCGETEVKDTKVQSGKGSCKEEKIDLVESSPPRQENVSSDETKEKTLRKRGRDISPPHKTYRTRGRLSADKFDTGSVPDPSPTKNNVNSASPSSPFVLVSDSDIE